MHTNTLKNKDLNLIKPLKTPIKINKSFIGAIDLETIEINDIQIPISISFSYILNHNINTIFELIDYDLLKTNSDAAVKKLWLTFMNKLDDLNLHRCIIFSHNLGSFDGYFIFKGLLELPEIDINKVNSIIDDFHRFISIDLVWKDSKFIFKDSLRIFPVSLQQLCSLFGVEGKTHHYNPLFNKISLFENKVLLTQFIDYSKQDSISLLNALLKAQKIYIDEHEVDIASIWSTSTLSLKIFRQKFLDIDIPILTNKLDAIIRLSYIGGSTDYYYKYGENLKHYDVNSLYPKAMCNPMPLEYLGESEGNNVRLEEVFGFAEARITTPDKMEIPLLPFKFDNETLHPLGSWIGVYFTEELKTIVKYGYRFEILWGYTFDKGYIFKDYVEFLYNLRSEYPRSNPLNFIAKILLNSLYGRFGMDDNFVNISVIHKDYYPDFENKFLDKIEDRIYLEDHVIVFYNNLDNSSEDTATHNVSISIAAAITAYSRIHMSQFKNNPEINLYYTDTDSIYTDSDIDESFIDEKNLGKLKLETTNKRAIFLTPKVYCLETVEGEFIHKVKGLSHDIKLSFQDFKKLLFKDALIEKSQSKWFRKLSEGKINILEEIYTLKVNDNKN